VVPIGEVDKARAAVMNLWRSIDFGIGTPQGLTCDPLALREVKALTEALVELPGARRSGSGAPLDFHAPSVWHAACSLLTITIQSRFRRQSIHADYSELDAEFGKCVVYRGQPRCWRIVPSAWRSVALPASRSASTALVALMVYLQSLMGEEDAIELDFIGRIGSLEDCAALAQHYGVPTSLVDFTFDPMVALYFASGRCEAPAPDDAPEGCADCGVVYFTSFEKIRWLSNVRLAFPPIQAKRLFHQSGFFVDYGPKPDVMTVAMDVSGPDKWVTQNIQRLFFNRSYPSDDTSAALEEAGFYPPESFLEDVILQLRAVTAEGVERTVESQVNELRARVRSDPPWRVRSVVPFIYSTDEFIHLAEHLERYVRMAALIDLAGAPCLDPLVLSSLIRTDARGLGALRGLSGFHDRLREATAAINDLITQTERIIADYKKRAPTTLSRSRSGP
jgi:hypothetical protein